MRAALEQHNAQAAGALLNASHAGLRDEYEVSCAELDFLADFAQRDDRVFGARMMGGGFGGCVIALLREATAEAFTADASRAYDETFGFAPEVIFFALGEGAREV
jgi:galactokinase